MPKIHVEWKGNMTFEGKDSDGHSLIMDASAIYGGSNQGVRPMEMLLISMAGCTGIEVGHAMNKMRLEYTSFNITADAVRRDEIPQIFTEINVEYTVEGQGITLDRFVRAFELGAVKYCSVASMLKASSKINYSFILNGQRHAYPLPGGLAGDEAES
ncbi:OsmC family protein [Desulfovibrio intestinalis]|uniref:Putative redox protein n=1 Tax=Desulfovibrio intestinalis TaxID=58621 RepID=A0A7W8FG55_9BACT|nr:OsmC family protein [Desulfovibrio intestinalis]MBB5143601.1 putative redox protein [Desulfovibrio intestinalis]